MASQEQKNILPPEQKNRQEQKKPKTPPKLQQSQKTQNRPAKSETSPNSYNKTDDEPEISAEEQAKIIDFLKSQSKIPNPTDEGARNVQQIFYSHCRTLEEVQKVSRERDQQEQKSQEEQKQKNFDEEKRRIQDLIKSAKTPKIFTEIQATDFKITDNNGKAAETAIKAITENTGLYIYGECGTGKTMLASVIVNERAKLSKCSMFIGAVDIFHELNPYSSDGRTAAIRKQVVKTTPCLIIDDLGAEKPSDWTKQTLFEVIDFRYRENLQTIITSNFNINELKSRLSEYEGNRIIRRIKAICRLVELNHF